MKKLLLSLLFLTTAALSFSQSYVSFKYSQIYSKFYYRDEGGKPDPSLRADMRTGYGLDFKRMVKGGIYVGAEFWYKNLGAVSFLNNQKLDWSLHYLDLNLGGGYMLQRFKVKPYIGVSFYGGYLFKANQTIATNYYNMLDNNTIKRWDYGLNVNGGVLYAFSSVTAVFFEVMQSRGLHQLEVSNKQKLYNSALSFRFGLSFLIEQGASNYNYKFRD